MKNWERRWKMEKEEKVDSAGSASVRSGNRAERVSCPATNPLPTHVTLFSPLYLSIFYLLSFIPPVLYIFNLQSSLLLLVTPFFLSYNYLICAFLYNQIYLPTQNDPLVRIVLHCLFTLHTLLGNFLITHNTLVRLIIFIAQTISL